jgi:spore coat polysaccharide biosynthesis predicted glycosyltransferase SpsG
LSKQPKSRVLMICRGSQKEGMGHLVRISALVEAFTPVYDVTVLAKQDPLVERFFKQQGIRPSTYRDHHVLYRFLEKTAAQEPYTAIIVDIYLISGQVLDKLETYCRVLVNFDDMKRRVRHPINGVYLHPQEPYNREIMTLGTASVYQGCDYFPLRQLFSWYREKKRFRKRVTQLGVILGGAPSLDYTLALTRLLDGFLKKSVHLQVVTGFNPEEIDGRDFSPRVHWLKQVGNMAEFIAGLDIGIIAGGFIKFEMMCIGTPFALVSLADHQHRLARKFSAQGYGIYMGTINNLLSRPLRFKQKLEQFITDRISRQQMYSQSRQLVDGKGSERILEIVHSALQNGEEVNSK